MRLKQGDKFEVMCGRPIVGRERKDKTRIEGEAIQSEGVGWAGET